MTTTTDVPAATRRGATNGNDRGSSADRRRRRAWLVLNYASNMPGFARCYRCGCLLYNPDVLSNLDDVPMWYAQAIAQERKYPEPLTIDRIIPGCRGGTYRRTNIRPACGTCNSETGGALARKGKLK